MKVKRIDGGIKIKLTEYEAQALFRLVNHSAAIEYPAHSGVDKDAVENVSMVLHGHLEVLGIRP